MNEGPPGEQVRITGIEIGPEPPVGVEAASEKACECSGNRAEQQAQECLVHVGTLTARGLCCVRAHADREPARGCGRQAPGLPPSLRSGSARHSRD